MMIVRKLDTTGYNYRQNSMKSSEQPDCRSFQVPLQGARRGRPQADRARGMDRPGGQEGGHGQEGDEDQVQPQGKMKAKQSSNI